jgi:hypothetical protein
MDARQPSFIEMSFTASSEDPSLVGQRVKIPNWPSDGALILVMFQ